jgi:hypothetical protein
VWVVGGGDEFDGWGLGLMMMVLMSVGSGFDSGECGCCAGGECMIYIDVRVHIFGELLVMNEGNVLGTCMG